MGLRPAASLAAFETPHRNPRAAPRFATTEPDSSLSTGPMASPLHHLSRAPTLPSAELQSPPLQNYRPPLQNCIKSARLPHHSPSPSPSPR